MSLASLMQSVAFSKTVATFDEMNRTKSKQKQQVKHDELVEFRCRCPVALCGVC